MAVDGGGDVAEADAGWALDFAFFFGTMTIVKSSHRRMVRTEVAPTRNGHAGMDQAGLQHAPRTKTATDARVGCEVDLAIFLNDSF